MTSAAAEAEMGALYINAREAIPMRITLEEMGHRQPPTPMQADYYTKHHAPKHHKNIRPEILTPVKILNELRTRLGKQLPVFTDRERVC